MKDDRLSVFLTGDNMTIFLMGQHAATMLPRLVGNTNSVNALKVRLENGC